MIKQFAIAVIVCAAAAPVHADGVIDISQTISTTGLGGCDTAGFPVTLCASGSYRLISNLTVPSGRNGIDLSANEITIDLNGFTIAGSTGAGIGINGLNSYADGIIITNGSVEDMNSGIYLVGDYVQVKGVNVSENGGTGLYAGYSSIVQEVTATLNGGSGIVVGAGSVVTDSAASNNTGDGIVGNGVGVLISDNASYFNGGDGIETRNGSSVTNNVSRNNTGFGLISGTGAGGVHHTGYRNNSFSGNTGGTVSGGIDAGGNTCSNHINCP